MPPYFVLGLTSLDETSHKQIDIWLFRVIQVKIQKSYPPWQFLVPQPGGQDEYEEGQSSTTTAPMAQLHRCQEGTCDVSFQHLQNGAVPGGR